MIGDDTKMLVLNQTLLHIRVTKSSAIEADLASYVDTVYDGFDNEWSTAAS